MDDDYCLFVIFTCLCDLAMPPVAYVVFAVMVAPIVVLTGIQGGGLTGKREDHPGTPQTRQRPIEH
jgi:hypothetical protein